MRMVFQVEHVMRGDSETQNLEGRDAAGRRVRLDVPASEGVRAGSVLVLEWWAAELPPPMVVMEQGPTVADAAGGSEESTATSDEAAMVELEFRRLIGLR
ncbi:MAG: hypothetical protein R3B09_01750 [Nannocystaceae bacterium]